MWVMLNNSFFSVVDKDCPGDSLLVRSRRKVDLERLLGPNYPIREGGGTDYQFRAVVSRDELAQIMAGEIFNINYTNFKDSVTDPRLHDAYLNVWGAMHRLAESNPLDHPGLLQSRLF